MQKIGDSLYMRAFKYFVCLIYLILRGVYFMAVVMNIEELSAKVKVSVSTLRKKVMRKEIPHIKIGSSVRFLEADIDRWIEEQAVKAVV